jgi:hypothetical protein
VPPYFCLCMRPYATLLGSWVGAGAMSGLLSRHFVVVECQQGVEEVGELGGFHLGGCHWVAFLGGKLAMLYGLSLGSLGK